MAKSNAGRPTVITEDALQKLEFAFSRGLSDEFACHYAGIAESTLYNYQNANPEYVERKRGLKSNLKMHARLNVAEAVIDKKDLDTSKYVLERTDVEYKPKTQSEHVGAVPVQVNVTKEEIAEVMRELDRLKR